MTTYDARRLLSPSGIPKEEWTEEVKEAVRYVNSHSIDNYDKEVYAFGEYKSKLTAKHAVLLLVAMAFTAAVFVPVLMGVPAPMKSVIAIAGALMGFFPLILGMMTMGKYTYAVTNAHLILYKNHRSSFNRWVTFGEYSRAELNGQALCIRSGKMIPRPDEPRSYNKGNEMFSMTLRGLEEFEAEKIYSAVNEALKRFQQEDSYGKR